MRGAGSQCRASATATACGSSAEKASPRRRGAAGPRRAGSRRTSGFAEVRQIYPAALVGLDLAALWARQGRNGEIGEIAGELVATFRALGIAREAIAALLVLQRACELHGRVADLVEAAAAVLRELQHRPVRVPA
jgi:hypothetical protein